MANSDNPITVLHSALTPDVYADNAIGIHTFAGNMRITFESLRSDYTGGQGVAESVIIGRLIMPVEAAERMAHFILLQVERLKTQVEVDANTTRQ